MRLRFADCALDSEARELRRAGRLIALSPMAFQLLCLLVEGRPAALSQQLLRDTLWPETHVGYTSLARLVAELRRALGDNARASRLIRTVQRFGYAFVADAVEMTPFVPARVVGAFLARDREYLIAAGENLLGRGENCGLRLASTGVSRVHARISADARRVAITDAGSKNGTWVNGQRREATTVLNDGDEVVFGTYRVVFRREGTDVSTRTGAPGARSRSNGAR